MAKGGAENHNAEPPRNFPHPRISGAPTRAAGGYSGSDSFGQLN